VNDLKQSIVDPDGRYTSGPRRLFERIATVVTRWRSPFTLDRTRDVIEIRFSTGQGVGADLVVLVTPDALELRAPTIEWTEGSHAPAASSELWRRVVWSENDHVYFRLVNAVEEENADAEIHEHLDALAAAHEASLKTCTHCNEVFFPDRMAGGACQGCAEEFEGVVH